MNIGDARIAFTDTSHPENARIPVMFRFLNTYFSIRINTLKMEIYSK